jgi:hypothetical protein
LLTSHRPGHLLVFRRARPSLVHPPLVPSASVRPPKGDDWIHEPKWDGFRFQVIKDGREVRLYSRHGAEFTNRLPGMVEAFSKLPTQSAILDGELVLLDPRGAAHFYRLMAQMRTSHPNESKLMFLVFDLLHQDGVDLCGLPLSERKRDLHRLCAKARVPFLREVQTFPNGQLLYEHCDKFGFEGIVSKRMSSRCVSGPSRHWTKTKYPNWKRLNADRGRLFETSRRTEPNPRERDLKRKREELARVQASLARKGLRAGMKDALEAQERILLQRSPNWTVEPFATHPSPDRFEKYGESTQQGTS